MPNNRRGKRRSAATRLSAVTRKKTAAVNRSTKNGLLASAVGSNGSFAERRLPGIDVVLDTGNSRIYQFEQYTGDGSVAQVSTTPILGAFQFAMSGLDQYATFAALFDQYRLDWIECMFSPMFRANAMAGTNAVAVAMIYTAVDYDDASTPGSEAVVRQYQNCICHDDSEPFVIRWKPAIALAAYGGSAFTSYANRQGQWIDWSSSGVPHYGLKYAITPGQSGQTTYQVWNLTTRLYFSCKNVR